jgi:hypothetical protein
MVLAIEKVETTAVRSFNTVRYCVGDVAAAAFILQKAWYLFTEHLRPRSLNAFISGSAF